MATIQFPTKLLIAGMAIAALAVGTGYATTRYKLARVKALVSECQVEHKRVPVSKEKPWLNAPLVCDPAELRRLETNSSRVGIQAEIVNTARNAGTYFDVSLYLAGGVLVLSAIPFAWYFLLRRVRELGEAIRGG